MDIQNITGLEKPLCKFIDVASRGCGIIYEPIRLKNLVKLGIIPEGYKQISAINPQPIGTLSTLEKRARASKNYKESLEQQNTEQVIEKAFGYMGDQVSDEEVDSAWRTRFFKKAGEVSHKKMQEVWGKVLAGEVTKPGSYSMRSLELLSNLTQKEAELFRKFSSFAEINRGMVFLIDDEIGGQHGFFKELSYKQVLDLEDFGLLLPQHSLMTNWLIPPSQHLNLEFKNEHIFFENQAEGENLLKMTFLQLTAAGRELLSLVNAESLSQPYVTALKNKYLNLQFRFRHELK